MSTLYQSSPNMSPTSSSDLALDSPSRQLLRDLRLLQIQDRRSFYEKLDEQDHNLTLEHNAGLAAAAAKHEQVRRDAEEMLRQYNIAVERQRRKEEHERRQREETIAREKREEREREEQEQRRLEAVERAKAEAAAAKAAAEANAKAEAEAVERERLEAKRREDEEKQLKKLEGERRAREAAAAEEKAKAERDIQLKATRSPPQPTTGPMPQLGRDAEQAPYLSVHRKLKELREYMKYEGAMIDKGKRKRVQQNDGSWNEVIDKEPRNPPLKQHMGDMRRIIRKCVGQLTEGKGANAKARQDIFDTLRKATQLQGLGIKTVNPCDYLAYPPPELASSQHEAPALFIYLLNLCAKYSISQWATESGVSTKKADPLGVLVAQVFSSPDFKYQGKYSMIDILLAKFRVVCPVLWGIYGDEKTAAGKKRIGWHFEKDVKKFVSEQRHGERMTGLGAGFASIALRNFSQSQNANPVPNSTYWAALANIINVPPKDAQPTHFIVLKSMIEGQEEKILAFFGSAGRMALRKALVDFPNNAAEQSSASRAVALLPEILARDKNIYL